MRYQVWHNFVLVIEDPNREIDVPKVNVQFNRLLLGAREISYVEALFLKRIGRKGNVVMANALSSLDVEAMLRILSKSHKLEESSDNIVALYPDLKLPKRSAVSGECHAGAFRHTICIDPGVKPLVDAINTIRYVRTFSSCEGHGKNSLYVSYRVYKRGREPFVLKLLEDSFNLIYRAYDFPLRSFHISFEAGYTDFIFNRMHLFFSVKVVYDYKDKAKVLKYIEDVSRVIKAKTK